MAGGKQFIVRYFMRYLFAILPLFIISTVVTQINITQFSQKEKAIVEQQLDFVLEDIRFEYQKRFEQSVALGQHRFIQSRYAMIDEGKSAETIEFLRTLKLFDQGVKDIFVYYGEGAVYGTDGKCNPHAYFKDTLNCDKADVEVALELINSEEASVVLLNSHNSVDYLLFHFPVIGNSYLEYRGINYVIPISYWAEIVQEIFQEKVRITLNYPNSMEGVQLVDSIKKNEINENYVSLREEIGFGELCIELVYDTHSAYSELKSFQYFNVCIVLIGIILSIIVSLGMSRRGGKKIEQIVKSIDLNKLPATPKGFLTDNFDYVKNLFDLLLQENQHIEEEKNNRQQIVLKQTSRLLFRGLLQDNNSVNQMFQEMGYELFEEYYCLFGITFGGNVKAKEYAEKIGRFLYDYLPGGRGNTIVFLEEMPAKDPTGKLREGKAQYFVNEAAKQGLQVMRIVSSQIYQELSVANQAYLETVSLLEYGRRTETNYLCWEQFAWENTNKIIQFPKELIEAFSSAIEERDLGKSRSLLHNMKLFINNTAKSADNQRYLRYCILHELMIGLRRAEKSHLLENIIELDPANDERFYEQAENFLHRLCVSENISEQQLVKIVSYIDKNYMRYDLSLEEIAGYAGISKVQMSKIFKKHMGTRYIDYLTQLRMERASSLLKETDISVKEILQQVGYIDKASFSKKFKDYYGINPSDYRKKAKDSQVIKQGERERVDMPNID